MATLDKDLAGGEVITTPSQTPLLAGQAPIITEEAILDTGDLAKYTVVGRLSATGKIVACNPAGTDGEQVAYGILTQAANATSADVKVAVYTAGFFNHEALVWPAALDTLAKRQMAFDGTMVKIGAIRL